MAKLTLHEAFAAALDRQRAGGFAEAEVIYRQIIQYRPDFADALNNLGVVLAAQGKFAEAAEAYRRAIHLNPNDPEIYANLGGALNDQGNSDEAMAVDREAIHRFPNSPDARYHLALTHILRGDLAAAWDLYEARWERQPHDMRKNFDRPLWDGSDLAGRRILLWAEQGFGDTIQFVRYAPLVAERGGKVLLGCQPPLQRLFTTVKGVEAIIANGQPLPAYDVHFPLMSLPLIFKTTLETIVADIPYLRADPQIATAWRQRVVAKGGRLNVGLVWAGSASFANDRTRSLSLNQFAPLAQVQGAHFYSLQKGPPANQARQVTPPLSLIDWTDELGDFADTAGLIDALDLVICSDTAIAHLAGAMGKPTWLLLTYAPTWTWLRDRNDSPWYPTMRLFRQAAFGDWQAPIDQVTNQLRQLLADCGHPSASCGQNGQGHLE